MGALGALVMMCSRNRSLRIMSRLSASCLVSLLPREQVRQPARPLHPAPLCLHPEPTFLGGPRSTPSVCQLPCRHDVGHHVETSQGVGKGLTWCPSRLVEESEAKSVPVTLNWYVSHSQTHSFHYTVCFYPIALPLYEICPHMHTCTHAYAGTHACTHSQPALQRSHCS